MKLHLEKITLKKNDQGIDPESLTPLTSTLTTRPL